MKINKIEFEPIKYNCPECGAVDEIDYTFKESNQSIQARCKCEKWIGNVKYDKRSKEQIRRDKINEWKKARKEAGAYTERIHKTT